MKRIPFKIASIYIVCFFILLVRASGQSSAPVDQQLLDMKLELLNSRIELFNSQLKVWETKPIELERKLSEVDKRITQLAFDPLYFNDKLLEIESLTGDKDHRLASMPRPVYY